MALSDKVQRKPVASEVVEVCGERYRITGLGTLAKSDLLADIRKRKLNYDCAFLAKCVSDPDDKSVLTYEQWTEVNSEISGPLMSVIIGMAGLDKEDIKRSPKDSSTTAS